MKHIVGQHIYWIFLSIVYLCFFETIIHYNDAAVYSFHINVNHAFFCPHHRYIGCLTQYLPLLGQWLHVDYLLYLKLFLLNPLFSTYMLYLIYGWTTKNWDKAWFIVWSVCFGIKSSFFYLVPEHFGYSFAVFSVMMTAHFYRLKSDKLWVCILLCSFILSFAHIYALMIFALGLCYLYLSSRQNHLQFFGIVLLIGAIFFSIRYFYPADDYEVDKWQTFLKHLTHYKELDRSGFRYFYDSQYKFKVWMVLLYMLEIGLIWKTRAYRIGIAILCVHFGLYYLNCVYFFVWDTENYMDLYARVIFFSHAIAIYVLIQNLEHVPLRFWNLIGILIALFFMKNIYYEKSKYENRRMYIRTQMEKYPYRKFYLHDKYFSYDTMLNTWALAFESITISRMEGSSKTFFTKPYDTGFLFHMKDTVMYSSYNETGYSLLRSSYFKDLRKESCEIVD